MNKTKLTASIEAKLAKQDAEFDGLMTKVFANNLQSAMRDLLLALYTQDESKMGELVGQYGEDNVTMLANHMADNGLLEGWMMKPAISGPHQHLSLSSYCQSAFRWYRLVYSQCLRQLSEHQP